MKNMYKTEDFLLFAAEAGEAVCSLLADEWMTCGKEERARDSEAFGAFCSRQRGNLFRIAAAADGTENLSFDTAWRTAGEILAEEHTAAFFSAAREDFSFALASLADLVVSGGDRLTAAAAVSIVTAKMRLRREERAYRAYISDALRLLTENTAQMSGGGYLREEAADNDPDADDAAAVIGKIFGQLQR